MSETNDERLRLPVEQGALLWCMRIWVVGLHRGVGVGHRVGEMMRHLGAPDAAPCVEGFMAALSQNATRPIGIDCVCNPRIAEDERALLDALGLAQELRPFEALLLLRGLVTPDGAREVLRHAEGLGRALAQAGRFLPAPDEGVRRFAFAGQRSAIRPPDATLH